MPQPMTIDQAFTLALGHHHAGRHAPAESIYRQIVAAQPSHADAWHLLGVLACQLDQPAQAIDLIGRAVALNPAHPVYHGNLGEAQRRIGHAEDAEKSFRQALLLDPAFADACTNYGNLLLAQDRLTDVLVLADQSLPRLPANAAIHRLRADALVRLKRLPDAVDSYQKAVGLNPALTDGHFNLGVLFKTLGRPAESAASFRKALAATPAAANLSADALQTRIQLANVLAAISGDGGASLVAAIAEYQTVVRADPGNADAWSGLANALRSGDRLDDAIAAYERSLSLRSEDVATRANYGFAMRDEARLDESLALLREALAKEPTAAAVHSGLIATMLLHPHVAPDEIQREQARWNDRHVKPDLQPPAPASLDRTAPRRIRIGYVSADLRLHPVGRFMRTLLAAHDRAAFEIFCYSTTLTPDQMSDKLQPLADHWINAAPLGDAELAAQIRADGIDILIDLSMHTVDNRLTLFALKPAPVQITYLAYCAGTGLRTMDYRLTDAFIDPPSAGVGAPSFERPLRLESYWCYAANECAGPLTPLPALKNGHITFGSLNYFSKVNDDVLALWSRVLVAVPASRLALHVRGASRFDHVRNFMAARGTGPERLTLIPRLAEDEYFAQYAPIDIALDPFPFAGGTTTLDALYMGVPVISRAGEQTYSRGGVSILSNLGGGAEAWIAADDEEYIQKAAALAADLPALQKWRETLRHRLQHSPLMDAPRFARGIEAAYRAALGV